MKFVIRILDAQDRLLAWGSVIGEPRPGGRWVASEPSTPLTIEADGQAASVTIEWTDLNIARKEDFIGETSLHAGQSGLFHWIKPIWVVPGEANVPVPPVTVRQPVVVGVPVGDLAAIVR